MCYGLNRIWLLGSCKCLSLNGYCNNVGGGWVKERIDPVMVIGRWASLEDPWVTGGTSLEGSSHERVGFIS